MAKINFKEILLNTGGSVAGGIAGGMLKKLPFSPVVTNGVGILAGAVLPIVAPKSALVKAVSAGLCAVAGRNLVANYVPAIGDDDMAVGDEDDALGDVYYENPESFEAPAQVAEDFDD